MSLLTTDGERQARPAGPLSSRGLLVTVLGELVVPYGGSAWTQTLIEVMELVGVSEKATRQLLTRSEDRGWLTRSRAGRRTRWHLTEAFAALLDAGAARIYRHATEFAEWDGRWSVALASLPDGEGDRHRLTHGLAWLGYGHLGNGTWICPRVDVDTEAADTIVRAGVRDPILFRAEIGGLGDDRAVASRAWPLEQLAADYAAFDQRWRSAAQPPQSLTSDQAVQALVLLVHEWRQFPLSDPDLPRSLLPDDWPAAHAATRFAEVRADLLGSAQRWWCTREGQDRPH